MDLSQRKLTKSEWDGIEIPVAQDEKEILRLILGGYEDVNIRYNKASSLFNLLKIDFSSQMEDFLYNKYFAEAVSTMKTKYGLAFIDVTANANAKIKGADQIRINQNDPSKLTAENVYEFLLLEHMGLLFKEKATGSKKWMMHYLTLYKLDKNVIGRLNARMCEIVKRVLAEYEGDIDFAYIIANAVEFVEQNKCLMKYSDTVLYEHQKTIFTTVKNKEKAKLVLYIAPTGTGKTMTPIGLTKGNHVIFVCAARHVGLALAKAAISVDVKIAFAFGCASAADIRLHYFSALEYTRNRRTGGIGKVDNSVGDKVEMIICDVKSYLPAMYYMLAFNEAQDIITYWDEPTITMDYDEHACHETIHKNWKENIIPNVVLSSATLPKLHELTETTTDFLEKFPGASICDIVSHDCKKSIPIIDKNGYVVMPHYMNEDYDRVRGIADHCENYLTILRYFDLKEACDFIKFLEEQNYVAANSRVRRHFTSLDEVDIKGIKLHYLRALKNILTGTWGSIYIYFRSTRTPRLLSNESVDGKGNKIRKVVSVGPGTSACGGGGGGGSSLINSKNAGAPLTKMASQQIVPTASIQSQTSGSCAIYVTTKDAYTLTDGPTIFLAEDVTKIAKFCIQQANIPAKLMEDIMEKIEYNNRLNERIDELEKKLEDLTQKKEEALDLSKTDKSTYKLGGKSGKGEKKTKQGDEMGESKDKGVFKITEELNVMRSMIKPCVLHDIFIPNSQEHLKKWTDGQNFRAAFRSDIDEDTVVKIMTLHGIDDSWKVLLLLGIGVFYNHENITYMEIMKKLAEEQKLYLIIASSDYIYGTNYQFCHGYISKDMNLTQEKIIQAMGRIGRNNIQQNYSIRCRDEEQITKLFTADPEKPEVINMNILFNSKQVRWVGGEFVEALVATV